METIEIRMFFKIKCSGENFDKWADKIKPIIDKYEPIILVLDEQGQQIGPIYLGVQKYGENE